MHDVESITLGMGKAKVTIEITRPDGLTDVVVIDSVMIKSPEDGMVKVTDANQLELFQRTDRVLPARDLELALELEGTVLPSEGGSFISIRTATRPKVSVE